MYSIIDLDEWVLDMDKGPGKGNREKEWLKSIETDVSGMFKVPRENRGEHWAEKLSCEIATILDFPHAHVDFAVRNNVKGCFSYFFVKENEGFSHFDGGTFFPYNYDSEKNNGYTISLISDVLNKIGIDFENFLFVIVFDALIANGDRHQDNWGITKHFSNGQIFISPLYDNSACLARELDEQKINDFIDSDEKLLRYIYKGKSKIGIGKTKNINHFSLIKTIGLQYPNKVKELIKTFRKLDEYKITDMVNQIPTEFVSDDHKVIIIKIILKRKNILLQIGDNMNKIIDSCLMIWKNPETRQRYTVGRLSYDIQTDTYSFSYSSLEIEDAIKSGFENYPNFPELEETYYVKSNLFKDIKNRIPNSKRPDFAILLDRYNLEPTSSPMEILIATKGRVATDNFEFVEEITSNENFSISIDVAGTRYSDFQKISEHLSLGDKLFLEKEPDNKYDKHAVKITTSEKIILGYIPRYYSKKITQILDEKEQYSVVIIKLDGNNPLPDEWISIKFSC